MQFTASPKIYENMLIARSLQSTLVSCAIRYELNCLVELYKLISNLKLLFLTILNGQGDTRLSGIERERKK